MDGRAAGFVEREHTADWELEAWAPDLPALFEQVAHGMYALSGTRLQEGPRLGRSLELEAPDAESLLVAFLSELLFLGEQEGLGFDEFNLHVEGERLSSEIFGSPLAAQDKEIKAVTYHNLEIRKTQRGFEVNIIFDV